MTAGYDVIALQETHQEANAHNGQPAGDPQAGAGGGGTAQGVRICEGEAWAREGAGPTLPWPGSAFWAQGVQGQRGVALLFTARAVEELEPTFWAADPHRRYISATCIFDGKPLTVTTVYGPHTPGERRAFFTDSLMPRLDPTHLHLVGGDFNCIADPFRDQSLPVATPQRGIPPRPLLLLSDAASATSAVFRPSRTPWVWWTAGGNSTLVMRPRASVSHDQGRQWRGWTGGWQLPTSRGGSRRQQWSSGS
jgi:hypothetical protein